jgi:hypothetical protein
MIPFYAGKNDWVTILIAMVPAMLATILIFMDQQITTVIGNRKEFKLKVKKNIFDKILRCLTYIKNRNHMDII